VGALGSSGDVLTSQGAGSLPQWTAPTASAVNAVPFATLRKPFWNQVVDDATDKVVGMAGWTPSNNSSVNDSTSQWQRLTATGANGTAFERSQLDGPMFYHLPTLYFHIRTGSTISTAMVYWIGLFQSTNVGTAIGTSSTGVLTNRHAAFRFAAGTDTQWVGSVSDGTTQTVSGNIAAIAASTVYTLKIRFASSTSVRLSVNGGAETTVTLNTSNADANQTAIYAAVLNVTAGNTRILDWSATYGECN
jgi:hypothetical protein